MTLAEARDQLVIPMRVSLRERALLGITTVWGIGGSIVWIALAPTVGSIVIGGAIVAVFVWEWLLVVAAHRALGTSSSRAITVTRAGISSSDWTIPWEAVRRVSIRFLPTTASRGLRIEPRKPNDMRWASSLMRVNARWRPTIEIPQMAFDRPLAEIIDDFERFAGRQLR